MDEPGRSSWRDRSGWRDRSSWRDRLRRSRESSGYDEYAQPSRGWAPNGLFYAALVLFIVLAIIALSAGPVWSVTLAVLVLAGAFIPRYLKRDALVNDLFQRTRKITKEEEYEADLAQDRRRFAALLRGDLGNAAFRTYFENVRKTVKPSKYIQIQFRPLSVEEITGRPAHAWMPQRTDIVRIVRRWPPLFEPNKDNGLGRVKSQVEAFLGEEVDMDDNLVGCYAVFTPKRLIQEELPDSEAPTSQL